MSDPIDRQAAIDICTSAIDLWSGQLGEGALVAVRNKIAELPSALGTNLAEVGTDCISRQQAIDAIEAEKINHGDYLTSSYVGYEMAEKVVKQLPPIQPKRGKCKWCERLKERNLRIEYYWIDQEGCTASFSEPHIVATGIANFCPNCGAKMRTAEQIVHDAIDNTPMAEDAYPGIKERLHKAVDDMREVTT